MLADCVEAASHSLKEYTAERIEEMVNNIIDDKLRKDELCNSPITFQDIAAAVRKDVWNRLRLQLVLQTLQIRRWLHATNHQCFVKEKFPQKLYLMQ